MRSTTVLLLMGSLLAPATAAAQDAIEVLGIERESPTLHSLGYRVLVTGDANRNAIATIRYRQDPSADWRSGLPLRYVEPEAMEERRPSGGAWLFAGSLLYLESGTDYQVEITIEDPDGGGIKEVFNERTWSEPVAPAPKRTLHVAPGDGGGSGTRADPFRGLEAVSQARPGDLFLLHPGTYTRDSSLNIGTSGSEDAPIVIRGAGDGRTIIERGSGIAISAYGKRFIHFEDLTIRNCAMAFQINGSSDIVIRRCRLEQVGNGVFGDAGERRILIADNYMAGIETYPKSTIKKELRGVQLSGGGHVICYNRIHHFRDGIDTRQPGPVDGVDIHNNEISECVDDGIELDFSDHNVRAFDNRITNVVTGISFQPIHGGPAYVVRNILMNVRGETFKLKLSPTNPDGAWKPGPHRTSGGVILHNTVVKQGRPLRVWSDEGPVHNFLLRNNLLIGNHGQAIEVTPPMRHCDLDHNAYVNAGKAFAQFANWNKQRYATIEDFAAETGQERHGMTLASPRGIFAHAIEPPDPEAVCAPLDARLAPRAPVVDRGQVLPGINDDFRGRAPDIGAVEVGASLPHYGPRDR